MKWIYDEEEDEYNCGPWTLVKFGEPCYYLCFEGSGICQIFCCDILNAQGEAEGRIREFRDACNEALGETR